jgi:hypothetical protein
MEVLLLQMEMEIDLILNLQWIGGVGGLSLQVDIKMETGMELDRLETQMRMELELEMDRLETEMEILKGRDRGSWSLGRWIGT